MASVYDSLTWAVHETLLKTYLGITTSAEDDYLERWFATAKRNADQYLNNPFTDDDDADEDLVTLYPDVVTGVYEWTKFFRIGRRKPAGLTEAKTKDLTEKWAGPPAAVEYTQAVKVFWQPHRMHGWQ